MSDKVRWGVMGTGGIASKFAGQMPDASESVLVASGSRSQESADAFAEKFGGRALGSYEALLADPDVEAVYISLPNSMHHPWTIKALEAGKHVLCEKPIAANAQQAAEMFAAAKQHDRVLIEAFMYRCHPAVQEAIRRVRNGDIGDVKLIRSHFTFQRPVNTADVRYQSDLAGGSIMDVGSYCVNFSRALAGREPERVHAIANICETGVDDYAAGTLDFGNGTLAVFTSGMTVQADRTTFVGGSEGFLAFEMPWFCEGKFTICKDGETETVQLGSLSSQYAMEADAMAKVLREGAAPFMTEQDTLGNMTALDQLRKAAGLGY
jgi:predicted dehydrogenase